MHPILSIGGAEIPAYVLFAWLGAAAACALGFPALKRAGLSAARSAGLLAAAIAAFLICARLWNLAVHPDNFGAALKWYTPKLAGLSLYGGIAGTAAVLFAGAKLARADVRRVADAMVIPGGVAFCFARIGCFLNGCCGGVAAKGPFGVTFPKSGVSAIRLPSILSFVGSGPVHPTQIYELIGAALGLAVAVWISVAYLKKPGIRFLLYAAVFSAVRLAVLPLRALTYPPAVKGVLYPCMYLLIILGSAVGIVRLAKADKNSEQPDPTHYGI